MSIDRLESRRMLSAAVKNHVLVIDGTDGADQIGLAMIDDGARVRVTVNDVVQTFEAAAFHRVRIKAGAGDDSVSVWPSSLRTLIFAGTGNDSLSGGFGRDTIFGEGGDDRINGGGGRDVLHGGRGNDDLQGDTDNDRVFGDAGRDTVRGGPGDDLVNGGSGADECHEGMGDDRVFGKRGIDRFVWSVDQSDVRDERPGEVFVYDSAGTGGAITSGNTGVAYTGVYSLSQSGGLAMLVSNLDEVEHDLGAPQKIGGKTVVGATMILSGQHKLLEFTGAGTEWALTSV